MSNSSKASFAALGGDQRCARAEEDIEDEISSFRDVLKRIRNQRSGLDRRVQSQIFRPTANERVHRGVVPDIGAVAAMLSEVDHVEMRRRANAVDEDQFVLRTVERAHASVRLVPEAQEFKEVAIDPLADGRDVVHVSPIHTNEVDSAIARDANAGPEGFGKKNSECLVRHFTGSHRELRWRVSRSRGR